MVAELAITSPEPFADTGDGVEQIKPAKERNAAMHREPRIHGLAPFSRARARRILFIVIPEWMLIAFWRSRAGKAA